MNPLALSIGSHGLLMLTVAGDLTGEEQTKMLEQEAHLCSKAIAEASQRGGSKIPLLMDITHFSGEYDITSVDIMLAFAKHNAPYVAKTASFGGSTKARMVGEIIAALAGRDNIKLFDTEEEAISWLKGASL